MKSRRGLAGIAGFALTLLLSSVAFSQQESERGVPPRELEAQTEIQRAAAAARARAAVEGEEVTYERILADPDNIDLNFRYAKSQIARADLKGAAATLERILLVNPDLAQVRLLYGIVLFRLDSMEESERMLKSVLALPIQSTLRDEVEEYLRQIRLRRKMTRWLASLSVGFQFDTNRNAAPSSKQQLVADFPLPLTGSSRKQRDTSFLAIESLRVIHDLGTQAGHKLFASFDHFLEEQTVADTYDLASFSLEGGAILKWGLSSVSPSVFAEHVQLSRETFLRSQGMGLEMERPVTPKFTLSGITRLAREDYTGISENSAASQRRGNIVTVKAGGSYILSPTMRLDVSGLYTGKDAKASYYDYDGFGVQVGHTWLLGRGQFLSSVFGFEVNGYNDADAAISARTRRDEEYRFRVTYGMPVSLLPGVKLLPKRFLENLTATLTFEQFRAVSNVENYTYSNSKVAAMVTKIVEF